MGRRTGVLLVGLALVLGSCGNTTPIGPALGGEASIADASGSAFALPIPTLTAQERRAFFVGNSFFNDNWVTAPASTEGRDGLGPLFNAQSCSSCHFRDGRGIPPDDDESSLGLLLRLSVIGPDGPEPDPVLGDQLQDRAIGGLDPEGTIEITYSDHLVQSPDGDVVLALPKYSIDLVIDYHTEHLLVSPRLAPQLPGVGLLEAIPEETILSLADPDDIDGDGISGRPHWVADPTTGDRVLGRFGWKAAVPTVRQQNAGAFVGDIGITSALFPNQPCTTEQTECLAAPSGGEPELDEHKLDRVTFYTRTLAVPERRNPDDPRVRRGEALFTDVGCVGCHTPTVETGDVDIPQLSRQIIHPFTDLLLHDMGPGLADHRPDGMATGSEWRTPPLWGIGLIETVNDEARYLHDGRARTLNEAILWHDGEARESRLAYQALSAEDMSALIAFLEDL